MAVAPVAAGAVSGAAVAASVGAAVGAAVGASMGASVGAAVGAANVGTAVAVGAGAGVGVAWPPQAARASSASNAASRIGMCFFQFMKVPLQLFGYKTVLQRSAQEALLLVPISSFPSRTHLIAGAARNGTDIRRYVQLCTAPTIDKTPYPEVTRAGGCGNLLLRQNELQHIV
jgi:hypothetical protein